MLIQKISLNKNIYRYHYTNSTRNDSLLNCAKPKKDTVSFRGIDQNEKARIDAQTNFEYSKNVALHANYLYKKITSMVEEGEENNFKNIYKNGKLKLEYITHPSSFNSKLVIDKVIEYDDEGNVKLKAYLTNFRPELIEEKFKNSSAFNMYTFASIKPYQYAISREIHPKRAYIGVKDDDSAAISCSRRFSWYYRDGFEIGKIEKGYKEENDRTIKCDEVFKWSFGELDSYYKNYENKEGKIKSSQEIYFQ